MNTNTACPIPPDVAAYLSSAAIEIATEQDFKPSSEQSLRAWMELNRRSIGERAQEKMGRLGDFLLGGGEAVEEVKNILSRQIYSRIPKPSKQRWNPRYVAYAAEHGCTPEEMYRKEKSMVNFICWKPKTT